MGQHWQVGLSTGMAKGISGYIRENRKRVLITMLPPCRPGAIFKLQTINQQQNKRVADVTQTTCTAVTL